MELSSQLHLRQLKSCILYFQLVYEHIFTTCLRKINLAFVRFQKVISTTVPEVFGGNVYILMPIDIFTNAETKLSSVAII